MRDDLMASAVASGVAQARHLEADAEAALERIDAVEQAGQRWLIIHNGTERSNPVLVDRLLDRARDARTRSPVAALEWASLAVDSAAAIDGVSGAEARALAYAEEGNALRMLGQWPDASQAFDRAVRELGRVACPLVAAEVLTLHASLACQAGQHDLAEEHLALAVELYRTARDSVAIVRCLIQLGLVYDDAGDADSGLDMILEAWSLMPEDAPDSLRLSALHNMIALELHRGRARHALEVYHRCWPAYEAYGTEIRRARGRWMAAQALTELGEYEDAVRLLDEVRQVLEAEQRHAEVALCWLDEAYAQAKFGDARSVMEICSSLVPVFERLGLRRETLVALRGIADCGELAAAITTLTKEIRRAASPPPGCP